MVCGSRGWGFKSPYLPIFMFWKFSHHELFYRYVYRTVNNELPEYMFITLNLFYTRTVLLWQEGLFIDFLQKKLADRWIRSFVISSANLFSDKVAFEFIYRVYIVLILDNLFRFNSGNYDTITSIFTAFLVTFLVLFVSLTLWYVLIKWVNYLCY